jgi:hypothetical protein
LQVWKEIQGNYLFLHEELGPFKGTWSEFLNHLIDLSEQEEQIKANGSGGDRGNDDKSKCKPKGKPPTNPDDKSKSKED